MPDEPKNKSLAIVVVVVLLGAVVAGWLVFKPRRAPNMPPIAALRLDFLDETNRVATLSDDGSRDPDGTLQSWRIAWGDGKEDTLSASPQKAAHTYAAEGEYTVSLWCVDNVGATSSVPAKVNITLDLQKRQNQAQAEAKREADRLKEEQARKEAERLEQERQKQLTADEARKAREQQELEEKRKAEAELARLKEKEKKIATAAPPPQLAAGLADDSGTGKVIFTPSGYRLGEFQIAKEKTEGVQPDGRLPVILAIRCVNFPDTPIVISHWQIDSNEVHLAVGRIRAPLSPGQHEVSAFVSAVAGSQPTELKADVTVWTTGECTVQPKK